MSSAGLTRSAVAAADRVLSAIGGVGRWLATPFMGVVGAWRRSLHLRVVTATVALSAAVLLDLIYAEVLLREEHGQVDIRACPSVPPLGSRVTVIPNHICPAVNLQDTVWWRDEEGQLQELAIDARGRLV